MTRPLRTSPRHGNINYRAEYEEQCEFEQAAFHGNKVYGNEILWGPDKRLHPHLDRREYTAGEERANFR